MQHPILRAPLFGFGHWDKQLAMEMEIRDLRMMLLQKREHVSPVRQRNDGRTDLRQLLPVRPPQAGRTRPRDPIHNYAVRREHADGRARRPQVFLVFESGDKLAEEMLARRMRAALLPPLHAHDRLVGLAPQNRHDRER